MGFRPNFYSYDPTVAAKQAQAFREANSQPDWPAPEYTDAEFERIDEPIKEVKFIGSDKKWGKQ